METMLVVMRRKIYGALCFKVLAKETNQEQQTFYSVVIETLAREV